MLLATARRGVAAWREPRASARLARALWIAWAVIVWNVVFDHAIVVAGRDHITAARAAAGSTDLADSVKRRPGATTSDPPFANMDDWMRPAVTRGFRMATGAGAAVLFIGLAAVRVSTRSAAPRASQGAANASGDEHLALEGKTR